MCHFGRTFQQQILRCQGRQWTWPVHHCGSCIVPKEGIRHSPAWKAHSIALPEVGTKNWEPGWGSCLWGVRKSFTEEMTPEMALETEELISSPSSRQEREAEGKCELSQRGRNPPRCMPEKWKEALYKFLRQRNSYILPDSCFHSKLRLCLLGHLVFRPYSPAII